MKVIVNSLPKSGTHLLGKLMEVLGFQEWNPGLTGALIRETHRNPLRNHLKRQRRPEAGKNGLWIDLDIANNMVSREWLHGHLNKIPDGSFVSGHLPYSAEISEFLQIHGFKILHIIRDPRDVLLSYINYQKTRANFPFHKEFNHMSLDESIAHVLDQKKVKCIVAAPLADRIENGIGWLLDPAVYFTKFESLIGPKGGASVKEQLNVVSQVCVYLGLNLSLTRLKEISGKVFDSSSKTFHKGAVAQWRSVFNERQQALINEKLAESIVSMGYD